MHSINSVHIGEGMYVCTFICIFILRTVKLILFKFGIGRSKLNKRCVNIFFNSVPVQKSQDSVVGIATGYGLDDRGVRVRVPVGSKIFSSPGRPDRLWGPPSLLSNGFQGLFAQRVNGWGVKLATHL
jgi:hypothetical protein